MGNQNDFTNPGFSGGPVDLASDTTGVLPLAKMDPLVATDTDLLAKQSTSEKGNANGYASLDGSGDVPDAQIPAGIARDSEVTSDIATHAGVPNAHHTRYIDAEAVAAAKAATGTSIGDLVGVIDVGGGTPGLDVMDGSNLTGLEPITSHEAAPDPHAGYQLESEKDSANGYAGLSAGSKLAVSQLPDIVTQGEAEAGTATTVRSWTAQRVAQAIAALSPKAIHVPFTGVDYNSNDGTYRTRSVGGSGNQNFSFPVPGSLKAAPSAVYVIGIVNSGGAPGASKDIDITVEYGNPLVPEARNQHTGSNTTSLYTIPAQNSFFTINVTAILASIAPGDWVGMNINHGGIGGSLAYLGVVVVP